MPMAANHLAARETERVVSGPTGDPEEAQSTRQYAAETMRFGEAPENSTVFAAAQPGLTPSDYPGRDCDEECRAGCKEPVAKIMGYEMRRKHLASDEGKKNDRVDPAGSPHIAHNLDEVLVPDDQDCEEGRRSHDPRGGIETSVGALDSLDQRRERHPWMMLRTGRTTKIASDS